jgi:hypothetical protein
MTLYDETIAIIERDQNIGEAYGALSAGDLSILSALLEDDAGSAMTTPDSANARFWRCLGAHGWMSEISTRSPMPIEVLNYRVTDRGYRAIPVVLGYLMPPDPER